MSPPSPRVPRGKKPGGQAGHPDQQRPFVPPDQVDTVVELRPTHCAACASPLDAELPRDDVVFCSQVWDIPPMKAVVTEYQQYALVCPCCGQRTVADLPTDMPPGAFGPHATALAALLHGAYRLSIRETTRFLGEVCGLTICSGSVVKSCERVSVALQPLDATIADVVQRQPLVWVDETGWHEHNERSWLWVGVSEEATLFRIDKRRSQQARTRLLVRRMVELCIPTAPKPITTCPTDNDNSAGRIWNATLSGLSMRTTSKVGERTCCWGTSTRCGQRGEPLGVGCLTAWRFSWH